MAAAAVHRKKPLTWAEEDCLEYEQRVASFTAASYIKMKASDEVKTQVPMVLQTLFGNSKPGFATEEGDASLLSTPSRGCVDPFGNFVFADQSNSIIRRISAGGTWDSSWGCASHHSTSSAFDADSSLSRPIRLSSILSYVGRFPTGHVDVIAGRPEKPARVDGDAGAARLYCMDSQFEHRNTFSPRFSVCDARVSWPHLV